MSRCLSAEVSESLSYCLCMNLRRKALALAVHKALCVIFCKVVFMLSGVCKKLCMCDSFGRTGFHVSYACS